LTNKEYALLEFLLRNKNRVLTRTAIIDHVWDISYDPLTNIVDAHIRRFEPRSTVVFLLSSS
jgi:DNA-binding response OmpR family regulator